MPHVLAHQVEREAARVVAARRPSPGSTRAGSSSSRCRPRSPRRRAATSAPGLRREREPLGDRLDDHGAHQVVRELRDLAVAERADVDDARCRSPRAPAGIRANAAGVAADHHRELARLAPATGPPLIGQSSTSTPRGASRRPSSTGVSGETVLMTSDDAACARDSSPISSTTSRISGESGSTAGRVRARGERARRRGAAVAAGSRGRGRRARGRVVARARGTRRARGSSTIPRPSAPVPMTPQRISAAAAPRRCRRPAPVRASPVGERRTRRRRRPTAGTRRARRSSCSRARRSPGRRAGAPAPSARPVVDRRLAQLARAGRPDRPAPRRARPRRRRAPPSSGVSGGFVVEPSAVTRTASTSIGIPGDE